ncbi:MAG: hypothetical protein GEV05_25815 [Betaproteobacteria bacterium]|nr:hypothetical protein [Betaproteobacteria bacterium]
MPRVLSGDYIVRVKQAHGIASDEASRTGAFAADGFPIDGVLQRRARRAAIGYCVLALYYVAVAPPIFRYVRWESAGYLAHDLAARAGVLLSLLAHVVANLILAAGAWRVMSVSRWMSWMVVWAAAAFLIWMWGSLGLAIWRPLQASAVPDLVPTSIVFLLVSVNTICFIVLLRAVRSFNGQRVRALHELRAG